MFIEERRDFKLSKKRKIKHSSKKQRWFDLIRSLTLVLIICKFLGFLAVIMLEIAGYDNIYRLLELTEEEAVYVHRLPEAMQTNHLIISSEICMICALGIYGFATLNRYMMTFYASNTLIFVAFIILTSCFKVNDKDIPRINMFKAYQENKEEQRPVHLLQRLRKCCGTDFYKFEDLKQLPASCCGLTGNVTCPPEKVFEKVCNTHRSNMWSSMVDRGIDSYIKIIFPLAIVILVLEAALIFYTVYRLGRKSLTASLSQESSMLA